MVAYEGNACFDLLIICTFIFTIVLCAKITKIGETAVLHYRILQVNLEKLLQNREVIQKKALYPSETAKKSVPLKP
jgi:hypothetical protein